MGESRIVEFDPRDSKTQGGTGRYDGTVSEIRIEGLGWSAKWNDTTNGTRVIDITVDETTHIMRIRETGNASKKQIWEGNYTKNGIDYRMGGVLVEDNGIRPPPVAFTIQANLELP